MSSNENLVRFASIYDWTPEKWDEARPVLIEAIRQAANSANDAVRGSYNTVETLSGKKWTPRNRASADTPIIQREVFRKIVDLDGLNDFTSTNPQPVPHGITTNANTFVTALYGAASDPGASSLTAALPLPYVDISALAACIELRMDATNIILESGTDYSAYTNAWVVIEYVQEA